MDYTLSFISSGNDVETITKTTLTVPYRGENNDTSLRLLGKGFPEYGDIIWSNMLHLLENFASINPPSITKSTAGQLWFDTKELRLKVFDGSNYSYIHGDEHGAFTLDNLIALLQRNIPQTIPFGYFDERFIKKAGDNNIGNLTLLLDNTLTLGRDPVAPFEAATKSYVDKITSTPSGIGIYLPLSGGEMSPGADIKLSSTGTVKLQQSPVFKEDAVNLEYLGNNYLSFAGPNANVGDISMRGTLVLNADSSSITEDSYAAVSAAWVMDKIKSYTTPTSITGDYILRTSTTNTNVSNTLIFAPNKFVKVPSIDVADGTSVVNVSYVNNTFVKKAGDTGIGELVLTNHPYAIANPSATGTPGNLSTNIKKVATTGWVNDRISNASSSNVKTSPSTGMQRWVEFPNGMIMVTGIVKSNVVIVPSRTVTHTIGITLPAEFELQVPYTVQLSTSSSILPAIVSVTSVYTEFQPRGFNVDSMNTRGCAYSLNTIDDTSVGLVKSSVDVAYTITGFKV